MARPYGKRPKSFGPRRTSAGTAPSPKNLHFKINGRYDLEATSLLLQKIIAKLQDAGIESVERCSLYLTPFNKAGERVILKDKEGRPVETIELAMPVASRFSKAADR